MRTLLAGELEASSPALREWAAKDILRAAQTRSDAADGPAEEDESEWLQLLRDCSRHRKLLPED